jgi:hypothetical protein
MQNNLTIKGSYKFQIFDTQGRIRDSWKVDNLVVNGGLAFLSGLLGGTGTVPTYIALGTDSTAVAGTQTALEAEITDTGLERAEGTVSQETTTATDDTFQITETFTATGSKTIEEVGIFNDASAGTMLSRALTTSKTIANGENIVVTYQLVFANA